MNIRLHVQPLRRHTRTVGELAHLEGIVYFVSDRRDLKRSRILRTLTREPMIAVLLAAANVEWTIGRCILVLGASPTTEIRDRLERTHGIRKYQKFWKNEICAGNTEEPDLETVIGEWDYFSKAFGLRHKLIHGRGTCSKNMAMKPVEAMLKAVDELYEFAEARGHDLNGRLRARRVVAPAK